jgi:hypothetical protein
MLWRGMLPAVYRHAIYTGIRMSAYEEIRDSLIRENKVNLRWQRSESSVSFVWKVPRWLGLWQGAILHCQLPKCRLYIFGPKMFDAHRRC